MNWKRSHLGGPIVALCLMIALGGVAIRARETTQLKAAEDVNVQIAVAKAKTVSVSVLAKEFTGAFTQANIADEIEAVRTEVTKQGLEHALGSTHPAAIVIVTEDPTGKGEVHLEIGLELPANAEVRPAAPLKHTPLKFESAVQYVHQGPYARLADIHHAVHGELQKASKSAGFPVVLNALDDPTRVPADKIRTVMITPVK
jgi:hypothetical protein